MAAEAGPAKLAKAPKATKAPASGAAAAPRAPARRAGVAKPAESQPLLLDTHALLWWLLDSPELSLGARQAIADPARRVLVSAATAWELATKFRIGKLPQAEDIVVNLSQYLRKQRFESLPISLEHAILAGRLPGPHRDPFDRMLKAQAQIEQALVVTVDPVFGEYGLAVVW